MGQCYITRRGTKTDDAVKQLGIYPTGNDGRPMGNVTVLDNVVNLSNAVFKKNNNVLSISLPKTVRSLEENCFQQCSNLQELSIPDKITIIPSYCFDDCTSISKITFPKSLTRISTYAFRNCKGLYDIIIPDDIASISIEGEAFSGCSGLGNETITKLATMTLGTIYQRAFAGLTGITEVTTNYVYDYYFSGCTNLKKATILHTLNGGGFGSYIFSGCNSLTAVILPDNATQINGYMFRDNTNLVSVNIPSSCTIFGSYAFSNTGFTSFNIPISVKAIEDNCFYNCKKLTDVTIEDDALINFGNNAFYSIPLLTDESVYNILSHAASVGTALFYSCNALRNIVCPNLRLWTRMFENCTGLLSIIIGKGDTGDRCFYGCTSLQEVTLSEGVDTLGTSVFYNCTALKKVYLPSSVTTARNNCLASTSSSYYIFYNCTALEDVQLGQDWNMSLRLNVSNNITVDSMVAMFNSLKDLTGETAKTLTLGGTNLAKLTDEQKSIATSKNWTLA